MNSALFSTAFDIGGGTFDVLWLRIGKSKMKI